MANSRSKPFRCNTDERIWKFIIVNTFELGPPSDDHEIITHFVLIRRLEETKNIYEKEWEMDFGLLLHLTVKA
jgi:hypothetical protein